MDVVLLVVGRTKTGFVKDGLDEYLRRLRRYVPYSVAELPDVRNAGRLPREEQKEAEGKLILDFLASSDHVALLDERGRQYTSVDYAARLQTVLASGKKRLVMVVGGPYGFPQQVYDRADELLSLSKMTFNHEMVRLFITEQVYRAMTILRNEPYHHA